jgi:hypothetical protein
MNKIQKNEIYDRLSKILTEHETVMGFDLTPMEVDLYDMLKEIQISWEELTGEDE